MDDARYFIGLLLRKLARREIDRAGLVRLQAKHLRNVMNQATYASVIDALLVGGAIERYPYHVGKRSFGFRLASRFLTDKHVRTPATDRRLIRRLATFHEQNAAERERRLLPVHQALAKQQSRLQIHGSDAREILATLPRESNPFDTQGILVRDIEDRDFRCNVGRYGRLSNNITNMKRELRQTLHVGNRKLVNVDLSCAQPAFIARIMQKEEQEAFGRQKRTQSKTKNVSKYDSRFRVPVLYDSPSAGYDTADFKHYRSLVQGGDFYDFMVEELDGRLSREVFKRKFLADVIAKRKVNSHGCEYPSIVEDAFQRLFPSVYHFIRRVNRDGQEHSNLIRLLQRAESELVIETIAADLTTRFPGMFCVTLHDAIFTTDEHLGDVEAAFRRAFDQTGFPMTLKIAS